ncbi:hypothetical protein A4S06_02525 [Erysipelotrichaceae bacterium MTC7]|nr:hypothetical protein A4S06_02525 [Erysipelotrichaceae bacterium MTC7]
MKKIVIFVILFLASCTPQQSQSKKDKYYFMFATPLENHEVWLGAKVGFQDACQALSVNCEWVGPSAIDIKAMEDTMKVGVLQGVDGIITQGVVGKQALMYAKQHKVPVVFVDADQSQSSRMSFFGKDFNEQANMLLADIEEHLGKQTFLKLGIQVAEKDFDIAQKQIEEIERVFATHPGGFVIQSISESKSESLRAKKAWQEVLETVNINVAINFAGESAVSCGEVAKALQMKDTLRIYGVDDMPQTIQGIKDGLIDGSVVTSFYEYGYKAVQQLYDYQRYGKLPTQEINSIKLLMVNKNNYQSYAKELNDVQQ